MRHRAVHGRVQDLVFVEMVHDPISAVNKDEILVGRRQHNVAFALDFDIVAAGGLKVKPPKRAASE